MSAAAKNTAQPMNRYPSTFIYRPLRWPARPSRWRGTTGAPGHWDDEMDSGAGRPDVMCGWCSSNAGRSERMRGIEVKLCRGGGQDVAHSSELPQPQGSSSVTFWP